MNVERLSVLSALFIVLMLSSTVTALSQTDFNTQYMYGNIINEFDSIYMDYNENATIDLDGDSVTDLKLSVRYSGSTHDIEAVNGAYFDVVLSNTAETHFHIDHISIDIDPTDLDTNNILYTNSGARTSRIDVYTTDGNYAHVIITMHSINATDNLYSYESYLQTDDNQPSRFSAYLLEGAYSVSLPNMKSIDGGDGSDYLYAVTSSTIYKIDKETGNIILSNTDYSNIQSLSFDDIHNHIIISIINGTTDVKSGDVIVMNESLDFIASADINIITAPIYATNYTGDTVTGWDADDFNGDGDFDVFYSVCMLAGGGNSCMVQGFKYDYAGASISSVFYQTATSYGRSFSDVFGVAVGDTNSDTYKEVNFFTDAVRGIGDTVSKYLAQYKVDSNYDNLSFTTYKDSATTFWSDDEIYSRNNIDIDDYYKVTSREEIAFINNDLDFQMYVGILYIPATITGIENLATFGLSGIDSSGDELALQMSDGTVTFYKYTVDAEDYPENCAGTVNVTYCDIYTRKSGDYALGSISTADDVLFAGSGGYAGFNSNSVDSYELCVEDWYTGAWSLCSLGIQTRTVTDLNSCGTDIGKPATEQSCDSTSYDPVTGINTSLVGSGDLQTYTLYTSCQPQYECTQWSDCVNGYKTQTCVDVNTCDEAIPKVYRRSTCVESDNVYWAEEIHATILYVDSVLWSPFANITMIIFSIALLVTIFYIFIDLFNLFYKKGGRI